MRLVIYRPDGEIDQMLELESPTAEAFSENMDIFGYMLDRGSDHVWRVFSLDVTSTAYDLARHVGETCEHGYSDWSACSARNCDR